ncbi:MAG TPA: tRNA (adenosine(37)-N6)-threonylcarbamoyltransferase complex ATPase subunit type 1 TsaE [Acidimicrobiales bacterium]|nr:tRNA (adenosine(37)-N6)-threonylcarbamoyltransferase complex ATPase subunit type 1 TsaE [Acidimicrobiales bacterium]
MEAKTASVEETQALAARLAELTTAGDLVVLLGDLGAGKTAFVKGLTAALGSPDPVTSPTFTIAQRYTGGRLTVHHLDAYRLSGPEEATDLALDELLDDRAVTVIEWGDRLRGMLPVDRLEIAIEFGAGDDDRLLRFEAGGPAWSTRLRQLEPPC